MIRVHWALFTFVQHAEKANAQIGTTCPEFLDLVYASVLAKRKNLIENK